MADGTVSPTLSEWLIVFLIVFSLIFEAVLHRFEHWLNHKHQHLQAVVRVLYRELMVLGFVSFLFILYQFIVKPGDDTVLTFEFAHILIFLLAVFYTFVVLSTMFISLRLSARWKKMEQLGLVRYLQLKEEYTRLRSRMRKYPGPVWRKFQWWFPNFLTLWRYRDLHEIMTFHDIRFQFIFYRRLPEHFRFSSFLRKIKSLTFIALVESHWTVLCIFLSLLLFDLLRRKVTNADDIKNDVFESAFIIGAAILLAIIVQILAIKIRKVYWELTKHPRIYYEGVKPADVAEELTAAQDRLDADRAKRRASRSADASEDPGTIADDEAADVPATTEVPPGKGLATPASPAAFKKTQGSLGILDVEKASPLTSDPATDVNFSEIDISSSMVDAGASRPSGGHNGRAVPVTASRHSTGARPSHPDNLYIAQSRNHSLDLGYAGRATEHVLADRADATSVQYSEKQRSRSSMSERSGSKSQPAEVTVPPQFQETAARHSLEITRGDVTSPQRVLDPSSQSSVALAAVAAARKRSIERSILPGGVEDRADPERRSIGTPRIMSRLSSRGVSIEEESRMSLDFVRASLDSRPRKGGPSIELVAAMPHEEIAERHRQQSSLDPDRDLEAGISQEERNDSPGGKGRVRFLFSRKDTGTSENGGEKPRNNSASGMNSLIRHKSFGFMNSTILKNLEQHQKAQTMEPASYPWIVKKLIPRLGRVASPVEKLFWFGSHKFFLWCVELTLYFSTVLTAAASADLALLLSQKDAVPVTRLNIASFVLPPITLMFVLLRIAGIIKKYTFILHNASLVPEALAIETIHNVSEKQKSAICDDLSDLSGGETEKEDEESARERRRDLGIYLRKEVEVGNRPGIEPIEDPAKDVSKDVATRRASKRRIALRLRQRRERQSDRQSDRRVSQERTVSAETFLSE